MSRPRSQRKFCQVRSWDGRREGGFLLRVTALLLPTQLLYAPRELKANHEEQRALPGYCKHPSNRESRETWCLEAPCALRQHSPARELARGPEWVISFQISHFSFRLFSSVKRVHFPPIFARNSRETHGARFKRPFFRKKIVLCAKRAIFHWSNHNLELGFPAFTRISCTFRVFRAHSAQFLHSSRGPISPPAGWRSQKEAIFRKFRFVRQEPIFARSQPTKMKKYHNHTTNHTREMSCPITAVERT